MVSLSSINLPKHEVNLSIQTYFTFDKRLNTSHVYITSQYPRNSKPLPEILTIYIILQNKNHNFWNSIAKHVSYP